MADDNQEKQNQGVEKEDKVSPGFVAGRIALLPFKIAFEIVKGVGKAGLFVLNKATGFAADVQNEYDGMREKTPEDIAKIAIGEKYASEAQKLAARKYIKDVTDSIRDES